MNNGQFSVSAESLKEASVVAIADLTNENLMLKALIMDLNKELSATRQKLEEANQTQEQPA